jgi:cadmium resistance transport/sequestration family protein
MGWIAQTITTSISAFTATNIDDIMLLMLFFSQVNSTFRPYHIVLGQYLGFVVLIIASLPGFFGGLLIPHQWVGLLGLLPIGIGVQQMVQQIVSRETKETEVQTVSCAVTTPTARHPVLALLTSALAPQTYSVAAVTVANGGDNIGIYVPLFATVSLAELGVLLSVFMVLVAVWCGVAYTLARHPAIAHILVQYGSAIVPIVLIALGCFILFESRTYELFLPH